MAVELGRNYNLTGIGFAQEEVLALPVNRLCIRSKFTCVGYNAPETRTRASMSLLVAMKPILVDTHEWLIKDSKFVLAPPHAL